VSYGACRGDEKKTGVKYLSSGVDESEPGSRGRVLRNRLGIISVRKMQRAEIAGYLRAERKIMSAFSKDQRLTVGDIHQMHRWFLGDIYPWGGRTRDVNISKGGFTFASAYALPKALNDFEREVLAVHTPCGPGNLDEVAGHIAVVHCELSLLHPYREGNGRTARLVAALMAYQAGQPGIDFGFIGGRGKEFQGYVSAIQAGMRQAYGPMIRIVLRALRRAARVSDAGS
jgi:cell filamentation protein